MAPRLLVRVLATTATLLPLAASAVSRAPRAPHFGAAPFHAHQGDYFRALVRLHAVRAQAGRVALPSG